MELREEFDRFRDDLKTHYATKADISRMETRILRWMLGMVAGVVGALIVTVGTLVVTLLRVLGS